MNLKILGFVRLQLLESPVQTQPDLIYRKLQKKATYNPLILMLKSSTMIWHPLLLLDQNITLYRKCSGRDSLLSLCFYGSNLFWILCLSEWYSGIWKMFCLRENCSHLASFVSKLVSFEF